MPQLIVTLALITLGAAASALAGQPPSDPALELVISDLEFPEGPAWDGKGAMVLSDCKRNNIVRIAGDGSVDREWVKGQDAPAGMRTSNGLTYFRDGSLFVCDHARNAILRVTTKREIKIYADNCEGKSFKGPNDLAFDPAGNLYFTDPTGSGRDNPVGCVYRVEAKTRKVSVAASGMAFPNGLAFSADAKTLYVCESQMNRILAFGVSENGSLEGKKVAADLSVAGPGEPDGMAVDASGRLWVTHYGARTVLVFEADGKLVRTIRLPNKSEQGPTNIEFAGDDLKTVYITDPGSKALYRMRSDVPGVKLFCSPGK